MGILAFLSGHGIKSLPVAAFEEGVDIFFNTLAAG
jgi:hypothetical protein